MRPSKKQDSRGFAPAWSRVFKLSILIIVAAGLIYGAQQMELFLIHDPRFALTPSAEYGEESPALRLDGIRYASRSQVLRVFRQDIGRSLYLFPMAERRKALLRVPWIKEASITRTWPNRITVRLVERQPVAFIELRSESISRWSLIDRDGVILEPPARTAFNLPVVTGVRPEESQSMRGIRVHRMLRMLDDLGPLHSRISDVDVSDLDDLKVTLKIDQRAVVLMLGDHNFRPRFQHFLDHYQEIQRRITDLSLLDLRLDDRITVLGGGAPGMAAKPVYAVGLDAGSAYTRCVICVIEDSRQRFLGKGEIESIGWTKSRIADQQAVSACIHSAIQHAELDAQISVESLVVGLGGGSADGANHRGVYEFGRPRQIMQDDLAYATDRAARVRLEHDQTLLHVFPQDFTVDGRAGYRNPKGATCARLEANVYIMTASTQEHENLIRAVHQAHFAVEETVFEPVASAYAAILPEDRVRGVALVDIGLHSTDLVVYDGDAVVLAKSLPICSDHFTRDVAFGLKVSYEDAERLKRECGCAILGLTADNSLIEVPSIEGRPSREAPRTVLNDILEARAEQLFFLLRSELAKAGMERSLLEGIVLTGGGSLLNGMCDMAERVLNFQARNGLPVGIQGWPEALNNVCWTAAAGLAMYSARLKSKREWKPKVPGIVGLILR